MLPFLQAFQNSRLVNPTPLDSCCENTWIFWNIYEIPGKQTAFLQIVNNPEHGAVFSTCDMIGVTSKLLQRRQTWQPWKTLDPMVPIFSQIQRWPRKILPNKLAKRNFRGDMRSEEKQIWNQQWRNFKLEKGVKLSNLGPDGSYIQSNSALRRSEKMRN